MVVDKVYHWSPSSNRDNILKSGLIINQEHEYENPCNGEIEVWKCPYICTSLDPYTALVYVKPTFDAGVPPLDLFQISISTNDSCYFRNDGGVNIIEVRLLNTIPPDRIRYLGSREDTY